jgi:hypothetical protein
MIAQDQIDALQAQIDELREETTMDIWAQGFDDGIDAGKEQLGLQALSLMRAIAREHDEDLAGELFTLLRALVEVAAGFEEDEDVEEDDE